MMKYVFLLLSIVFGASSMTGQHLSGRVLDIQSGEVLQGVKLEDPSGAVLAETNVEGKFELKIKEDMPLISFIKDGYEKNVLNIKILDSNELFDYRVFMIPSTEIEEASAIPIIDIEDNDLEDDQEQEVSSLLTASRDPFISTAAYNWGPLRFRIRGYNSEDNDVYINGVRMEDQETRRIYWGQWGGLNDVTRNRYSVVGLGVMDYAVGGPGGVTWMDMRPSVQRKQTRFSYSLSNRSYTQRLMGTYTTGVLPSGWSFAFSGSRRWANEGYLPGTFYDAWGYYGAAEKKINHQHSLSLIVFGAPSRRGKSGAGTMEMYEIAGSHYYNPYWGYQVGKKRNSRVAHSHIPVGILEHRWMLNENVRLNTSLSFQKGSNGSTGINWADAPDPRADYYQKWPSYFRSSTTKTQLADWLSEDENNRQVQWEQFYLINASNPTTITNANGSGKDITGNRSLYVVQDRRYDYQQLQGRSTLFAQLSERLSAVGGIGIRQFNKHNFNLVDDLLGGDYWLDINKYETDFVKRQYDIEHPNKVVYKGDTTGYNYTANIREWEAWGQGVYTLPRLDFFLSGKVYGTTYWRKGFWKNGFFPDRSQGLSKKKSFLNYTLKGGVTYKVSGKQYLVLNGMTATRPPSLFNSMISPRTRNDFIKNLTNEKILSGELSWIYNSPEWKGRVSLYHTDFVGGVNHRSAFFDSDNAAGLEEGEFGNIILTNIDRRNQGVEMALEMQLGRGFQLGLVGAYGAYRYTSRMGFSIVPDDSDTPLDLDSTIYSKNFRLAGTPEQAYSAELRYSSPRYWFAALKVNYLGARYLDFYPYRRTADFTQGFVQEDPQFKKVIEQERVPGAMTLDFFGGKSFRFNHHFIYLTLGVNNLLNNTNIITGGYEQYRVRRGRNGLPDLSIFPNKYYYSYGLNYFLNISFRL